MKKVVITANFGGRDYPKDPVLKGYNKKWKYICYTDTHFDSDIWDVRVMQSHSTRLTARNIKIMTHEWVKFDVCLWIDASMTLKADPDDLFERLGDNSAMFKIHPDRETTYQEIKACMQVGHFGEREVQDLNNLFDQLGYTRTEQNKGLIYETGLYIKRNDRRTKEFMRQWYDMTCEVTHLRDQLSLPYLQWREKLPMSFFMQGDFLAWVEYVKHRPSKDLPEINYVSPYATDGNLGKAYNDAVSRFDDDEIVAICDQDMCFLDARSGRWLAETIDANPSIDIFVPMTNRLRHNQQVVTSVRNVPDIRHHKHATVSLWKKHQTSIKEPETEPAGLMMVAKAKVFKDVKFRNGLLLLDTDFFYRAMQKYKVGIMKGIFVFHYYRLAEGGSDQHLRK